MQRTALPIRTVVVSGRPSCAFKLGPPMRPVAPAAVSVARKRRRFCVVGVMCLPPSGGTTLHVMAPGWQVDHHLQRPATGSRAVKLADLTPPGPLAEPAGSFRHRRPA